MNTKLLALIVLSLVPELSGCILRDFSLKGNTELDVDVEPVNSRQQGDVPPSD